MSRTPEFSTPESSTPEYKTLKNGSIDYNHYIRASHTLRSQSAHGALRAMSNWLRYAVARIAAKQAASPDAPRSAGDFCQPPARQTSKATSAAPRVQSPSRAGTAVPAE